MKRERQTLQQIGEIISLPVPATRTNVALDLH